MQVAIFDFDAAIGRDTRIEYAEQEVLQEMDDIASNATSEQPIWYNTLTHGDKEIPLGTVVAHVQQHYAAESSKAVWLAPSDAIYSYIWLREHVELRD